MGGRWMRAGVVALAVARVRGWRGGAGVVPVLLVAVLAGGGCAPPEEEALVLGVIEPSLNHLPYELAAAADHPGLQGVRVRRFTSGWEANEALVAGRLDAAILPFTYAWSDVDQGRPVQVAGFLERESDGIVARREVGSLEALAGGRIGVLRASTLEILAVMALRRRGLEAELVPLRTPSEMAAALRRGDVDALSFYVPPILTLGDRFHVVHWYGEDHPGHPCCNLVVHTGRIAGKRDRLARLQAALAAAARQTRARPDTTAIVATRRFGLPLATARRALTRLRFQPGREAAGRAFERRAAAVMHDLGYLHAVPDTGDVYLAAP